MLLKHDGERDDYDIADWGRGLRKIGDNKDTATGAVCGVKEEQGRDV